MVESVFDPSHAGFIDKEVAVPLYLGKQTLMIGPDGTASRGNKKL